MEQPFLERPVEPFGNTIGLRFGDEGKAWRDAAELGLIEEVVSRILRAVVHGNASPRPASAPVSCTSGVDRIPAARETLNKV